MPIFPDGERERSPSRGLTHGHFFLVAPAELKPESSVCDPKSDANDAVPVVDGALLPPPAPPFTSCPGVWRSSTMEWCVANTSFIVTALSPLAYVISSQRLYTANRLQAEWAAAWIHSGQVKAYNPSIHGWSRIPSGHLPTAVECWKTFSPNDEPFRKMLVNQPII